MRYYMKNKSLYPFKKNYFIYEGRVYVNPTDEQCVMAGYLYKAADYDVPPEEKEGYYYVITPYRGDDDMWHKEVTYYEIPDEETVEVEE